MPPVVEASCALGTLTPLVMSFRPEGELVLSIGKGISPDALPSDPGTERDSSLRSE